MVTCKIDATTTFILSILMPNSKSMVYSERLKPIGSIQDASKISQIQYRIYIYSNMDILDATNAGYVAL